jgi:hypothetical protein
MESMRRRGLVEPSSDFGIADGKGSTEEAERRHARGLRSWPHGMEPRGAVPAIHQDTARREADSVTEFLDKIPDWLKSLHHGRRA